jgi:transposase
LEADHLARIVVRQTEKLDRTTLEEVYRGVGVRPYDPLLMLRMALYSLLKGIASPARWCEEAKLNEAVQWLGHGYTPSRRTWYDFRDRVGKCIDQLHAQLIQHALDQEQIRPTIGVLDGTSFAACASRHRMVNDETLEKRRTFLERVIDGAIPKDEPIPMWVPPTDSGRCDLAHRMDRAREVLNERIAKNAEKPKESRKDPAKIQVSLSDVDAPLGRDKFKVYRPLYTVQYLIEPTSRLILGYHCDATTNDSGTLALMIDLVQAIVGGSLQKVLADAAYCSILDLRDCQDRNVELFAMVQSNSFSQPKQNTNGTGLSNREAFVWNEDEQTYFCPAGHRLDYRGRETKQRHGDRSLIQHRFHCDSSNCLKCPLANGCVRDPSKGRTFKRLEGQELLDAQRQKMSQPEAKEIYKLRGQTVELGFADAKGNRRFDRYHGRGLARARTETGLLVLAQNLIRLDRLERNAENAVQIAA